MTRICTILARGGTKGVPKKNIRLLAGKPLIAWSVEQAKVTGLFDVVAVSSDASEILDVAKDAGADLLVKRPPELATDKVSKMPAVHHCVVEAENVLGHKAEVIVDLQPTSPLREPSDIIGAVSLQETSKAESVITGQIAKCSPYFSLVEETTDGSVHVSKLLDRPIVRRQDAPNCYDMNGSIYVFNRNSFMAKQCVFFSNTQIYVMPEERSVDIDTEMDFLIAEFLKTHNSNEVMVINNAKIS